MKSGRGLPQSKTLSRWSPFLSYWLIPGIGLIMGDTEHCFRMKKRKSWRSMEWGCLGLCLAFPTLAAEPISYNRDIRPILSDDCFHCHGPDQKTRKGKFRLDVREESVAKGAIVPGKPRESKLIERIFASDPDDMMPPPEAHKTLSAAQKALLSRWIASGAGYEKHWAYVPPVKPVTPPDKNPIDILVRQRLRTVGIK